MDESSSGLLAQLREGFGVGPGCHIDSFHMRKNVSTDHVGASPASTRIPYVRWGYNHNPTRFAGRNDRLPVYVGNSAIPVFMTQVGKAIAKKTLVLMLGNVVIT